MSLQEDYYETRKVQSCKSDYTCAYCNEIIKAGTPADNHKYYPEFCTYRTHPKCSDAFLSSEYCDECGEITDKDKLQTVEGEVGEFCEECRQDMIKEKL